MLPKTTLSILTCKQKLNPEELTKSYQLLNSPLSAMPLIAQHWWAGGIHVLQHAKVVARQRSQVNLSAATEENIW